MNDFQRGSCSSINNLFILAINFLSIIACKYTRELLYQGYEINIPKIWGTDVQKKEVT